MAAYWAPARHSRQRVVDGLSLSISIHLDLFPVLPVIRAQLLPARRVHFVSARQSRVGR